MLVHIETAEKSQADLVWLQIEHVSIPMVYYYHGIATKAASTEAIGSSRMC